MHVINFILLEHEKYTPVVGFGDESAVVSVVRGAPATVRLENIRKLSSNLQYAENDIILRECLCFIYRKTSGGGGVKVCVCLIVVILRVRRFFSDTDMYVFCCVRVVAFVRVVNNVSRTWRKEIAI